MNKQPTIPNWHGQDKEAVEILNDISFRILEIEKTHELLTEDLSIIIYAGEKEMQALWSIDPLSSVSSPKDNKFLGARIIRVAEGKYLHVTRR